MIRVLKFSLLIFYSCFAFSGEELSTDGFLENGCVKLKNAIIAPETSRELADAFKVYLQKAAESPGYQGSSLMANTQARMLVSFFPREEEVKSLKKTSYHHSLCGQFTLQIPLLPVPLKEAELRTLEKVAFEIKEKFKLQRFFFGIVLQNSSTLAEGDIPGKSEEEIEKRYNKFLIHEKNEIEQNFEKSAGFLLAGPVFHRDGLYGFPELFPEKSERCPSLISVQVIKHDPGVSAFMAVDLARSVKERSEVEGDKNSLAFEFEKLYYMQSEMDASWIADQRILPCPDSPHFKTVFHGVSKTFPYSGMCQHLEHRYPELCVPPQDSLVRSTDSFDRMVIVFGAFDEDFELESVWGEMLNERCQAL